MAFTLKTYEGKEIHVSDDDVLLIENGNPVQVEQVISGNARKVDIKLRTYDLLAMTYVAKTRQLHEQNAGNEFFTSWYMTTDEGEELGITEDKVKALMEDEEYICPCVMLTAQSGGYPAGTVLLAKVMKNGDKKNEILLYDMIDTSTEEGHHKGVFMFESYLKTARENIEKAKKEAEALVAKGCEKKEEAKAEAKPEAKAEEKAAVAK